MITTKTITGKLEIKETIICVGLQACIKVLDPDVPYHYIFCPRLTTFARHDQILEENKYFHVSRTPENTLRDV